jgi:hypothetical protein
LIAGTLPRLNEGHGVVDEALAGRRQARARLVADKQPAAELVLKRSDPGAYGRLGQVQTLRGDAETATRQDFEKRAGKVDIHYFYMNNLAGIRKQNSLVCRKDVRHDCRRKQINNSTDMLIIAYLQAWSERRGARSWPRT